MSDLYAVVIGGIIGIVGTLFGAIVTHWLDLRRDRIQRQNESKKEIRDRLLEGVSLTAEKHGRTQIPFDGGNSLYFPTKKESPDQVLVKIIEEVKRIDETEKIESISDALQLFLENLQNYIEQNPKESK